MGDSVSIRTAKDDSDKLNLLSKINSHIQKNYPDSSVANFAGSGFNFRHFSKYLLSEKKLITGECVVVAPLNLRSFSHQWSLSKKWNYDNLYLNEGRSIVRDKWKLYESYFTDLIPFEYVGNISRSNREFRHCFLSNSSRESKYAEIFIFHYGFITPSRQMRLAYENFLTICSASRQTKLILYFTPINFGGMRLLSLENICENIIELKVKLMSLACEYDRVYPLDLSEILRKNSFFHEYEPTEHLNQHGREQVMTALEKNFKEIF